MPNNTPTPSAKDRVLAWVRSKNPQTMELKFGCRVRIKERAEPIKVRQEDVTVLFVPDWQPAEFGLTICSVLSEDGIESCAIREWSHKILGSDMGLQELLIAFGPDDYKVRAVKDGWIRIYKQDSLLRDRTMDFDLAQNLHNQPYSFYEALLPLIPDA